MGESPVPHAPASPSTESLHHRPFRISPRHVAPAPLTRARPRASLTVSLLGDGNNFSLARVSPEQSFDSDGGESFKSNRHVCRSSSAGKRRIHSPKLRSFPRGKIPNDALLSDDSRQPAVGPNSTSAGSLDSRNSKDRKIANMRSLPAPQSSRPLICKLQLSGEPSDRPSCRGISKPQSTARRPGIRRHQQQRRAPSPVSRPSMR